MKSKRFTTHEKTLGHLTENMYGSIEVTGADRDSQSVCIVMQCVYDYVFRQSKKS